MIFFSARSICNTEINCSKKVRPTTVGYLRVVNDYLFPFPLLPLFRSSVCKKSNTTSLLKFFLVTTNISLSPSYGDPALDFLLECLP